MKEISIYVRIIDLILLVLAFLDSGVKSVLILAAVIFFLSALMQVIMSYKRVRLNHHV